MLLTLDCLYGICFLARKTNVLPVLYVTYCLQIREVIYLRSYVDFQNYVEIASLECLFHFLLKSAMNL